MLFPHPGRVWPMHLGQTVFAQLLDFIPAHEFRRCVERYQGNYKVSSFSCWDQFLCMAFAQLTYRESLRDIETCLRALGPRLYHAGIRGPVSRSTLADANELRDWRIYADLAQVLIAIARPLYAHESFGVELQQTAYALDCTTIDLCLSLFPWARYRALNAAASCRMYPERTRNLWLATSASAGASRRVGIKSLDQRCMIVFSSCFRLELENPLFYRIRAGLRRDGRLSEGIKITTEAQRPRRTLFRTSVAPW